MTISKIKSTTMSTTTQLTLLLLLLLLLLLTPLTSQKPIVPTQPAVIPTKKPSYPPKLPPPNPFCPRDALKLGVCADVLGAVNVVISSPPSGRRCCALLQGLTDAEVASCFCTALKANVLGSLTTRVDVALSLLVSSCKKDVPDGFKCI